MTAAEFLRRLRGKTEDARIAAKKAEIATGKRERQVHETLTRIRTLAGGPAHDEAVTAATDLVLVWMDDAADTGSDQFVWDRPEQSVVRDVAARLEGMGFMAIIADSPIGMLRRFALRAAGAPPEGDRPVRLIVRW